MAAVTSHTSPHLSKFHVLDRLGETPSRWWLGRASRKGGGLGRHLGSSGIVCDRLSHQVSLC